MRGLVFYLAVATLCVAGVWGLVLGRSQLPDDAALAGAFPDLSNRQRLRSKAEELASRVAAATRSHVAVPQTLLVSAAVHALFVRVALPVFLPALAAALALGLFRREAARTLAKFSSPTVAFAAKKLFLAALLALVVFALTPVAVPFWTAYAALGVMVATVAVYVENIPVKI